MTGVAPRRYSFGRFELQAAERRLLADGAPVAIGPRAFDVLVVLVQHAGSLVAKDELLDRVWSTVIVEDNTLQAQISALRKVLGREAIATVSGRGYRFTLELDEGTVGPSVETLPRHNLPTQLTAFIGRTTEIAQIRQLLAVSRLLTLTGTGGCGKTRMALQVAADVLARYPDGVWLVELGSLADPNLVPRALGSVLGVTEQNGKTVAQSVVESLADKRTLIVLDNAEHLLLACAQLTDVVLRQCAHVTVLATSRERLGVDGERTYRVPSLSVPDETQAASPELVAASESAQLFIERARLQRPQFEVTARNAPALAAVCRQLDGIPLAIELAAPRVRSMSLEEVNLRLDRIFGLLTGGSSTALPRHRTLRSLIDWSYDLLSAAEQALLRRLCVFSGGFTLDAAERACAGDGIDTADVLDLLASLCDKCLVTADEQAGATRYRLLETIRQYAFERLRERGEEARWRARHFTYCLSLAKEVQPLLSGPDQKEALGRLAAEYDNLRSAMAWSSGGQGDAMAGLELAESLRRFWWISNHRAEGCSWFAKLLDATQGAPVSALRARALGAHGLLTWVQGDFPGAIALQETSLAIGRDLGDREIVAAALNNLGNIAQDQGDVDKAQTLMQESLRLRREIGDRRDIAVTLNNLGILYRSLGDLAASQALHEESLAMMRELGDRSSVAAALLNLAIAAWERGDYAAMKALCLESLAIHREIGERHGIASALATLGVAACDEGDTTQARAYLKDSLREFADLGERHGMTETLDSLAHAWQTDRPASASRIWGGVARAREEMGYRQRLSDLQRYERQLPEARAALGDDEAFDRAWQEGRAMNLDQLVQYALGPE
jgi:predicted ATPase/DNA-binding winged helix-turn-helix (wHTH) protein